MSDALENLDLGDSGEKKPKKKKAKGKGSKLPLYLGIGVAVVALEVGISYVLVNKMLMPTGDDEIAAILNGEVAPPETSRQNTNAPAAAQPAQTQAVTPNDNMPSDEELAALQTQAPLENIAGSFSIPDFVINPKGSQGKHFFVVTIVFTYDDKKLESRFPEMEPVIMDRIITTLSRHTFEWFTDIENREIVRREVLYIAMNTLKVDRGIQVLFTKYVLQ